MIYDVIIIGGGPAGLAAGMMLKDKKVLLLEKNPGLGEKLLISGSGQCNLTHGGPLEDYEGHYGGKWRTIRNALLSYTPDMFLKDLQQTGLNFITREDLKIFPESLKAEDVLKAFISNARGVSIQTNQSVISINKEEYWHVNTSTETFFAHYVIVATGGMTYPKTGSTGDAYQFAKALGVQMIEPRFGLAPVYIKDYQMASYMGISFQNITIDHYRQKKIGTYKGDLLLTHFGLSGPVILNNSRYMMNKDILNVNFLPLDDKESLNKKILEFCKTESKKQLKSFFQNVNIPSRLVDFMFLHLKIDGQVKAAELDKNSRQKIVEFLCYHSFEISAVGKAHIAMVTTGGIALAALKSKSFAWKKDETLHFVGECIDVDGDTGGYNIQFAVSSAVAASKHILEVLDA
ncbi:MAG: aminoacetone oxidase family FAD-binding enzyme [Clostridia bacterium]|nr:aminoacetone oxidase family FAD-binding enzyme [Clostridia bacterium]